MEMKENASFVDENTGTTRLVSKSDGSKVPFSEQHLRAALEAELVGLNNEYINLDIILQKVSSGLYNGKSLHLKPPQTSLVLMAVSLSGPFFCQRVSAGSGQTV